MKKENKNTNSQLEGNNLKLSDDNQLETVSYIKEAYETKIQVLDKISNLIQNENDLDRVSKLIMTLDSIKGTHEEVMNPLDYFEMISQKLKDWRTENNKKQDSF